MLTAIQYIFTKKQKRQLVGLFFILFIGSFVELLGVSAIMPLINIITDERLIHTEWYYLLAGRVLGLEMIQDYVVTFAILLIVVYVLKNLYVVLEYDLQYRFTYTTQQKLYIKLMKQYMHQDYLYHTSVNVVDIQRNITNDVNQLLVVVSSCMSLLGEVLVCIMLVGYLAIQDFISTVIIGGVLGVFVLVFLLIYRKYSTRLGKLARETSATQNKWLLQSFAGIKEVKVSNTEDFFIRNFSESCETHLTLYRKQSFVSALPKPVMEAVCISGLLLVMVLRIQMGESVNTFLPFLSVFVIAAFRMLPSFNRISGFVSNIMFGKPCVNNVYNEMKRMDEKEVAAEQNQEDSFQYKLETPISIEHLSFTYPEAEEKVLSDISFEIPKNQSVALIGASGSGKTTMADLILGVLEPQEGKIVIDGENIYDHLHSWHEKLSYIPQTIYLMDDTIRNNVAFGVPENEIDDALIWKALKEAQLDEFIKSLPEGLETEVGDRGVRLSGGQRQRIGIARALYREPQVLILDEATSALDNETETAVMEAIDGLHGSLTMVVIAHRLTTIQNCDQIYEVGNKSIRLKSKAEVLEQIKTASKEEE